MDPDTPLTTSRGRRPKRIRRRLWASPLGALLLIAAATVFAAESLTTGNPGPTPVGSDVPVSVDDPLPAGPVDQSPSGPDTLPGNPGDQGQGAGLPGPYGYDDDLPTSSSEHRGGDQESGSAGAGGPCQEPPGELLCRRRSTPLRGGLGAVRERRAGVHRARSALHRASLAHRAVLDEDGNPIFVDVERTVRVPLYRSCVDSCGGHEIVGDCACKPARCCEDESKPGPSTRRAPSSTRTSTALTACLGWSRSRRARRRAAGSRTWVSVRACAPAGSSPRRSPAI